MQEPQEKPTTAMFREPGTQRSFPMGAVIIAAVAVLIVIAFVAFGGGQHESRPAADKLQPTAPYAANLAVSNLQMSESGSMSGGKQTYIEGTIANHGSATVTGITVQAVFANDAALAPQMMTEPLNIIYMRQPYVDTRAVSASPLAPGAQEEFRLIFEDINSNWNQQMPQLHVTYVATR